MFIGIKVAVLICGYIVFSQNANSWCGSFLKKGFPGGGFIGFIMYSLSTGHVPGLG